MPSNIRESRLVILSICRGAFPDVSQTVNASDHPAGYLVAFPLEIVQVTQDVIYLQTFNYSGNLRAGPSCGVPEHRSLSVSPDFLFLENRLQPPRPSLRSKGQVQMVVNQGREGQPRKNSTALGQP